MRIIQNSILVMGLLFCLSGAWMRRSEGSRSRGTMFFWLGFALMLFGLWMQSDVVQSFIDDYLGRPNKNNP
jgi:hypothetical protein